VVNKNKEAAVKKKFAKEDAKSFHIHLPHFLCYFLVGLMLNPIQWEWQKGNGHICVNSTNGNNGPHTDSLPNIHIPKPSAANANECPPIFYMTDFLHLLVNIWRLRITFPFQDILLHTDNIEACALQSHWLLNIDQRKIIIPTLHIEIRLINKFNEEVTSWMQLNVEALTPQYDVMQHTYLETMEDETEAKMKYEGNIVSTELKKKLKDAKKNQEGIHCDARGNFKTQRWFLGPPGRYLPHPWLEA
jgi:hypothetical protein